MAGKKWRIPLGAINAIPLAEARKRVQAIMGAVAGGTNPAAERKEAAEKARAEAAREVMTLAALLENWSELHLSARRPGYAAEAVRALKHAFGKQLDRPAEDLDRASVVRVFDKMAHEGRPVMAAQTASYGRAAYNWALKRGTITTNPFSNLPATPMVKREKVLSDEELAAIWQATGEEGNFNRIVRALILTGQRREEVAGMTWDELSPDLATWTLPASRAKNGEAHAVPLSAPMQDLIKSQPRFGELVFSGLRGAFSGWSKSKAALDARSDVRDWRLHDLRRTAATGLQKLGVRLEVTEAVLNHISGSRAGITGIYQRYDFAKEKRDALEAWGERVMTIVEGRAAATNVIELRSNAAV
jgi:integrase